jgi:hypothetical protein
MRTNYPHYSRIYSSTESFKERVVKSTVKIIRSSFRFSIRRPRLLIDLSFNLTANPEELD